MNRTNRIFAILCTAALLWACGDDDETTTDSTTATDLAMTDAMAPGTETETPEGPSTMDTDPADRATTDPTSTDIPGNSDTTDTTNTMLPEDPVNPDVDYDVYAFESRFIEGVSSIKYTGQSARHMLIKLLTDEVNGLTDTVDADATLQVEGGVQGLLDIYFRCADDVCDEEAITVENAEQDTVGAISTGKNLVGKLAGKDVKGQHKNWTGLVTDAEGNPVLDADMNETYDPALVEFTGWTEGSNITPEGLVDAWIGMLDAAAVNRGAEPAVIPNDPWGNAINKIYVTEQGHDLKQLLQKFLLGAVAFSQGADDYLDYDTEGKGLLVDNEAAVIKDGTGLAYTALEHNWDEGFGYFGAARDYLGYTDDEIAKKGGRDEWQGAHDTSGDGEMDLSAEYNWGHAINAAKRDRGHSTDLTADAFNAFYAGRALIAANPVLTDAQMDELKTYSDTARWAWEKAIAATCIRYINDVIADLSADADGEDNDDDGETDEADEYNFYDHAKHWSELKGFALSLQFSPISPLTAEHTTELHGILGTAPTLPTAADFDLAARKASLEQARTLLGTAYEFEAEDVTTW